MRRLVLASFSSATAMFISAAGLTACGDDSASPGGSNQGGAGGNGGSGAAVQTGGSGGLGGSAPFDGTCPTTITFETNATVGNVRVAGEWNGFDLATATPLSGPTVGGEYQATIDLPPGLHGYKIIYDDAGGTQWVLNPSEGRRKYVGGVENSAVKVSDCSLPSLRVVSSSVSRSAPSQGKYDAVLDYAAPRTSAPVDPARFVAEHLHAGAKRALGSNEWSIAADGTVTVSLSGLQDGKHRVVIRPAAKDGETSVLGEPLRLVFWVEQEAFDWRDAIVYMVVTDRYRNGNPNNDAPKTAEADPRGDWQGGDLEGLRQAIEAGTLDALGVRAIWLTPFQTNPTGAYLASDGVHKVTGYHGYWPTRAREVDPRLGGEEALRGMIEAAHEHGIRVLQDYVVNHVHQDHEYVAAHPDWFRTGCVCGTDGCDWTEHALDCMFASYLPDINHSVPEANKQLVDDAIYWLDELDLDGLRVDAVKHVEEVATRNLSVAVREEFEAAGTQYFLMGETAMGWSDCPDPCNDQNYGTIARYLGPDGLDGQFDFVLYHGVSYRTFAYGDTGMLHADYWLRHGLEKWPKDAVMTPYIGSHDTSRFLSMADYRGQDAGHDRGIPGNQWDNTAIAPSDSEPYRRTRVAMAWLLNLPGAPLLYYGDEYGQWGGADPNNRLFYRSANELNADEAETLAFVQALGRARRDIPALRRGEYLPLHVTEDTLVFARRISPGAAAIVGLTRSSSPVAVTISVGALGFSTGNTLKDALGGADVSVGQNGMLSLTIPASSAVVLHP